MTLALGAGANPAGDASPTSASPSNPPTALDRAGELGSNALVPFVAVTELALLTNGDHRGQRALRGGEAFATTFALTEALKFLTHERRPNGADNQSFPSGHASLSFAAATLLDAYQPHYKGLGYGMATWISLSRVQVKAHYFHDVVAGAVLGSVVTHQFTRKYRGSNGGSPAGSAVLPAAASASLDMATSPAAAFADSGWHAGFTGRGLSLGRSW